MKKDGKYRYSLQFGSESEEEIRVGEFLEELGNKKSAVVVAAINEYLVSHPELQIPHCKIEVKVASATSYKQEELEQLFLKYMEKHFANFQPSGTTESAAPTNPSEASEADIALMLENLDQFL